MIGPREEILVKGSETAEFVHSSCCALIRTVFHIRSVSFFFFLFCVVGASLSNTRKYVYPIQSNPIQKTEHLKERKFHGRRTKCTLPAWHPQSLPSTELTKLVVWFLGNLFPTDVPPLCVCVCVCGVCVCVCVICTFRGGSLCSVGLDASFGSGLLRPLCDVVSLPSAESEPLQRAG